jgi:hypothetical protein
LNFRRDNAENLIASLNQNLFPASPPAAGFAAQVVLHHENTAADVPRATPKRGLKRKSNEADEVKSRTISLRSFIIILIFAKGF